MSQLLDEFWAAEDAARGAEKRAQKLVDTLRHINDELKNWRHIYITGAGSVPASLQDGRNPMDGTGWPTMNALHEAMTAHAAALEQAKRAWDKVSAAERERVQPPYWLRRHADGNLD